MNLDQFRSSRLTQFLVGAGILLFLGIFILTLWWLATREGFVGDVFSTILGITATPLLLEFSFVVMGLITVLGINYFVQKRQGDEYVYLEQVDDPELGTLPEQTRQVIYRSPPERVEVGIEPLDLAEGAADLDDFSEAWSHLNSMPEAELEEPRALNLRLRLAMATGKLEFADKLAEKLQKLEPDSPVLAQWRRDS